MQEEVLPPWITVPLWTVSRRHKEACWRLGSQNLRAILSDNVIYGRFDVITNCDKVWSTASLQKAVVRPRLTHIDPCWKLGLWTVGTSPEIRGAEGGRRVVATSWRPGNGRTTLLGRRPLGCPTGPTCGGFTPLSRHGVSLFCLNRHLSLALCIGE